MAGKILNGIDVTALGEAIHEFRHDAGLCEFQFRTRTRWLDGGHSQTSITDFFGAGKDQDGRQFTLEADEPRVLLGKDAAPNPVEHLLNALGCCLTGAMVYHAAGRGISIEACECELKGELDLRGFLGLRDDVRKGYQRIDVTFHVQSDATAEQLEECARFSPVLDVVSNGTTVALDVRKVAMEEAEPAAPEPPEAPASAQP